LMAMWTRVLFCQRCGGWVRCCVHSSQSWDIGHGRVVDFRGVCEVRDRYNNMEFYVCKQKENNDTKADRLFHENSGVWNIFIYAFSLWLSFFLNRVTIFKS
jgi:hypothetical protein